MKTLKFKPYFMEPLRSMKKRATIRKSDKGLKKGDVVECVFEGCQNKVLTEVFINLVKLILTDNQPDFRKYFHDCTYCES